MDLDPELTKNTYDVLNGLDIKKAMLTDNKYFYFIPHRYKFGDRGNRFTGNRIPYSVLNDP